MNRKQFLLGLALCLPWPCQAQAQLGSIARGVAWTKIPPVVVVASGGDARITLVNEAVAHWNGVLAGIGSAFRLGSVSQGSSGAAVPGKIVVVLSDGVSVSHVNRSSDGQSAVVMIRNDRGPPMSLPNVARNVIAHEMGHAIGIGHNSDPALLMCGRPAPCRPGVFASPSTHYFPLSAAERARLLVMYPAGWKGQ